MKNKIFYLNFINNLKIYGKISLLYIPVTLLTIFLGHPTINKAILSIIVAFASIFIAALIDSFIESSE